MNPDLPKEVLQIGAILETAGFEAYLVGGCVRDLILSDSNNEVGVAGQKREPKDWDIATNATPQQIQELFPESVYENTFGTVGVKTESEDPKLKVIEVTTFRIEGKYSDKRHPDEVKFAKTIEEDLSRRDFTINAMALALHAKGSQELIDPYGGQEDLRGRVIRTVGTATHRFDEDALRLMRAVRFATELNFEIDFETRRAIEALSGSMEFVAKERVRDEFEKMLMSVRAAAGIVLLEELNLLLYVLPELREGIGMGQNKHHIYSVFEHNVRALEYCAQQNYSLVVRLASLLHDVGKPRTKYGDGPDSTFHNHEVVGARMAAKALDRLHFSKHIIEQIAHLIRFHMFYYNVGEVSEAGVRRFLARVGPENVDDLLKVREADRIGSGVPKAFPYKLRHLLFMIEKVKHDPVSPKMLKIDGNEIMQIAALPPGPKVGQLLALLLEDVLDDPTRNTAEYLTQRTRELAALTDAQLQALAHTAREKAREVEAGMEEEMKGKYRVQ